MNSLTTLDFANSLTADAERHWLYGHPYRTAPRDSAYIGGQRPVRPHRRSAARRLRAAGALVARRRLAA